MSRFIFYGLLVRPIRESDWIAMISLVFHFHFKRTWARRKIKKKTQKKKTVFLSLSFDDYYASVKNIFTRLHGRNIFGLNVGPLNLLFLVRVSIKISKNFSAKYTRKSVPDLVLL